MEIIEMKNIKIKNGIDGFNWRLDIDEEKINDLEYRLVEDIEINLWRVKNGKCRKEFIRFMGYGFKIFYVLEFYMGEEGKWGRINSWRDNG